MATSTPASASSSSSTSQHDVNRWEDRWASNNIGWDQGGAHPALVALLGQATDSTHGEESEKGTRKAKADKLGIKRDGRALVPGCGMGYDVALFAQYGLDATGLDIAPTGVQAAREYLQRAAAAAAAAGEAEHESEGVSEPQSGPGSGSGSKSRLDSSKMRVELADFFEYDPGHQFDVILDYTFLCALPPSLRPQWASHMRRHAAPDCRLITLMFPLYPLPGTPEAEQLSSVLLASGPQAQAYKDKIKAIEVVLPEGGPPHALSERIYHELLDEHWELVYLENIDRGRTSGPKGGEKLGVWARRN